MKNIWLIIFCLFVSVNSEAKTRVVKDVFGKLTKAERITPHNLRNSMEEAADHLQDPSLISKLFSKQSVEIFSDRFVDGARLKFSLYKRKSRIKVFHREQSENMYLRVELDGIDYHYAGQLREALPNSVYYDEIIDGVQVTVVESDILKNVKSIEDERFRLSLSSSVLYDFYKILAKRHGSIPEVADALKTRPKSRPIVPRPVLVNGQ